MDSENVMATNLIEEVDQMSEEKLKSILEAILFAASAPISLAQFQDALPGLGKRAIRNGLTELGNDYQELGRSFHLTEIAKRLPNLHASRIFRMDSEVLYPTGFALRCLRSALETLAIVAYKLSRSHVLMSQQFAVSIATASLIHFLKKGLVRIAGRKAGTLIAPSQLPTNSSSNSD